MQCLQTDEHGNFVTESVQWANSVKKSKQYNEIFRNLRLLQDSKNTFFYSWYLFKKAML